TYAGKEVVQLYVSCPKETQAGEYQKLAAFSKTEELKPGESQTLSLTFDMRDLASYRERDAVFVLEKGDYILRCGSSSRNTSPSGIIVLEEEAVTEQCVNICLPDLVQEMEPPVFERAAVDTTDEIGGSLKRIKIKTADICKKVHRYDVPKIYTSPVTDTILNSLSEAELCDVVTGAGAVGGGPRFFEAPGSAGFTTGKLMSKGLPNVCLADGPAGLRLQKTSAVSKNGSLKGVEPMFSGMNYMPCFVKKIMLGNPEKYPCVYQFTTSFPTGLALAQSWNTALAEQVGEAVGKEMERYGVTYWLAPGMNIHRNPLCGRNFEYYSEDPLLSGKMAAAMSRGVQSRKGCYVTIKHFCCNNQEDNRNRVNVRINERALREIYLKGFQIAVREGQVKAVMSSYNKVNGTYVNNSYDLLTKVLRNEWGFDGLVMTDWFATGEGLGNPGEAIKAGNDLIMPGGGSTTKELIRQRKTGELDAVSLRRSAANVIRGVVESRIYQAYKNMFLSD
ncbi:MAG: fibronectin type III-like domain-contianing protein, partial [Clostridium sp.]|nr:fibronectin type III-like domain-contianing protein [Clostridium sp.]